MHEKGSRGGAGAKDSGKAVKYETLPVLGRIQSAAAKIERVTRNQLSRVSS